MLERRSKQLARKIVSLANDIEQAGQQVDNLDEQLTTSIQDANEIRELEQALSFLESEVEQLEDFTPEEISELSQPIEIQSLEPLKRPRPSNRKLGQDSIEALSELFAESVNEQIKKESFRSKLRWEPFDFWAVGSAGLLASITDAFLVGLPAGIGVGPVTAWMKSYNTTHKGGRQDLFALLARELEQICKVPYDTLRATKAIEGMCGRTHRFQTLGHDPVLGFVFGVLDILRRTVSGFSYDKLKRAHQGFQFVSPSGIKDVNLIEAFLIQIGHLLSDVATPAGLPAPCTTLLQSFNTGSFGKNNMTVAEVARWMYGHGYDLRHFFSSGISVGVGKTVLVGIMMLRELTEGGPRFSEFRSSTKFQRMSLAVHSLAALGNAGKITLHQGNPLAINQAQWMALFQTLAPALKNWLLQEELELDYRRAINDEGWKRLLERAQSF